MTNPNDGMQVGSGGFDLLSRLGHGDDLHKQARAEIERLKDALKRVRRVAAEGTTHTGMIAALGILVDRALNPGNGPLPPDYTYRSDEPCEQLSASAASSFNKTLARSPRRITPARDADHCDYPDCEHHWELVVDWALAAMKKLHESAEPDTDHPEIPAIIPAAAFRAFVDEHARLMRIRASAPQGASRDASSRTQAPPECTWCAAGVPLSADGRRHQSDMGLWGHCSKRT
jgi:hypothetical protein